MKEKFIKAHMDAAGIYARLSSARRMQVGSIVVKDERIVSIGYNGTPTGWDNNCEDELEDGTLKTKPEVLHAEANAITKLAKSNESGDGASIFVTHQPCIDCAKLIYQSGIKQVFYKHNYRCNMGIDFLQKCGVEVRQVEE